MSFLRAAKYLTKGYSEVQTKILDATSNSPQPPTGSMMNDISRLTYNPQDLGDILEVLDKRLNDKGKNWRHVYKSLLVIDYILHSGSEATVLYFLKNVYIIRTLKEFQYVDEEGKDHGANVRVQAKNISNLLADEPQLRQVRRNRVEMRDRMLGRTRRTSGEDEMLENENHQRRDAALAMEPDAAPRECAIAAIRQTSLMEDRNLINAIKKSKEDEEKRQASLKAADQPLFDDIFAESTPNVTAPASALPVTTGMASPAANPNNPFPLIPLGTTTQAAPSTQLFVQPEFNSYNPYQAQQDAMQAEYLRQQQEWMQQQAQAQLQAAQEAQYHAQMQMQMQMQAAQQHSLINPYQQQQQPLIQIDTWIAPPQPSQPSPAIGSKNPFLSASSLYSVASSSTPSLISSASWPQTPPSASSPASPFFSPSMPNPARTPSPLPQNNSNYTQNKLNMDTDHLASLFAARDDNGMDTFGNLGQLRFGQNYRLPA